MSMSIPEKGGALSSEAILFENEDARYFAV
jgi:hypothetical protein